MKSIYLLTTVFMAALSVEGCKASHRTETTKTKTTTTQVSKPEKFETEKEMTITCKSGNETRTIEVVKSGDGCEVLYTKGNADAKSVAQGTTGIGHCRTTAEKMRTNLTGAGWGCKI